MPRVIRSDRAEDDLIGILTHIARKNRDASDRLAAQIEEKCELLAQFPLLGTACDEIRKGLRYFTLKNFVIFYCPMTDGIQVIRIVRGARDFKSLFDSP